jgi:hypothetical protein
VPGLQTTVKALHVSVRALCGSVFQTVGVSACSL